MHASSGLYPAALQGCESSVDVIVAKPFLQFLTLGVVRIADGFQQAVVTWDAITVLAWTMAFSAYATSADISSANPVGLGAFFRSSLTPGI